jgi:hypothetical protein
MVVTQPFYCLGIVANDYRVCTNFGLRESDSYLHIGIPQVLYIFYVTTPVMIALRDKTCPEAFKTWHAHCKLDMT